MSSKKTFAPLLSAADYDQQRGALERERADISSARTGAQTDIDRLRFRGADVADLEAEVVGYDKRLAEIASSLRGLALEHATSTATARADALKNIQAAIAAFSKERIEAAQAVDDAMQLLGKALAAHATAGLGARGALFSVGPLLGQGVAQLLPLGDKAVGSASTLQGALFNTLQAAAQHGCTLAQVVTFHGFSNIHGDNVQATAKDECEYLNAIAASWKLDGAVQ